MMIREKDNFFETSDGAHIYFEDYGEGKPILLIPGYLCTSYYFRKNIAALSANHRLILVDARGHGSSSKVTHGLNIPRMAQDIKELVDFLGLEDLSLMGWSMGSSVALSYYEQYGPHRLAKMGIIDSVLYPFWKDPINSHSLAGFDVDGMNRAMLFSIKDHESYCRSFARLIFKEQPTQEDEDWAAMEMAKCPPWIAFGIYSDFLFRDYMAVLPTLSIPTLICTATSPAIPRSPGMGEYYCAQMKTEYVYHEFKKGGHTMFYETPEEFNEVVLGFVQGN